MLQLFSGKPEDEDLSGCSVILDRGRGSNQQVRRGNWSQGRQTSGCQLEFNKRGERKEEMTTKQRSRENIATWIHVHWPP